VTRIYQKAHGLALDAGRAEGSLAAVVVSAITLLPDTDRSRINRRISSFDFQRRRLPRPLRLQSPHCGIFLCNNGLTVYT
jgi:hypothetical protein